MESIFANVYIDEDISPLLAKFFKDNNFDALSSHEIKATGLNDEEQLSLAIKFNRVLISADKKNFLIDSKAKSRDHCGIILIVSDYDTHYLLKNLAKNIIKKYLNVYTPDEFKNLVVYI